MNSQITGLIMNITDTECGICLGVSGQIEMLATIPTLNSNNIKPGMLTAAIVKLRLFIYDTLMGC